MFKTTKIDEKWLQVIATRIWVSHTTISTHWTPYSGQSDIFRTAQGAGVNNADLGFLHCFLQQSMGYNGPQGSRVRPTPLRITSRPRTITHAAHHARAVVHRLSNKIRWCRPSSTGALAATVACTDGCETLDIGGAASTCASAYQLF